VKDTPIVRQLGADEREYWDQHIQTIDHVHPLNAFGWGEVRRIDGWSPVYLVAERSGTFCGGLLLLIKRLPMLPFAIFYGPQGPVCRPDDRETIEALYRETERLARVHRAIFLRIDPNVGEATSPAFEKVLADLGFSHLEQRWTYWNSPRDEYRVDLAAAASVDELHNALDRDTRRCIRKSAKDGLTIETATTEDQLKAFYDIFRQFSVNRGFMARGYEYQRKLWETYVARGRGRLFLAIYEGKIIGGLICINFGRKCVAMHMGTPYKYQKLQTYYAYVWESIRWAKESGCTWYSFRGVGTTPTQEGFKRKFNPQVVALLGYYDRPFRPALYKMFYWIEFTLLPAAWPWLVKARRIAGTAMKPLRSSGSESE
jgi:lipid II:glycine glycyltransferase (peptidoglycan interpeptide bridge formation enzyme)